MSTVRHAIITNVTATGEEIAEIVQDMEQVLSSYPESHAVIACLMLATAIMNPHASAEEVQKVAFDTSNFMCLALDGVADVSIIGSPAKEVMN